MIYPTEETQPTRLEGTGLVSVFTGNGKGKTTAALGTAVRAAGYGFKVFLLFFMKGADFEHGEINLLKRMDNIVVENFGQAGWVEKGNATPEAMHEARRGFHKAREVILSNIYQLVVLDEMNPAIYLGLIPLEDVLSLIEEKPKGLELILTGRYAPAELIRAADLVTDMQMIKHPYYSGITAHKGIDY